MKRGFARVLRGTVGALIAGGLSVAVLAPGATGRAAAQNATVPAPPLVSLQGAGSWAPYMAITRWQNELSTAPSPVDFRYPAHGTLLGRQDLLGGTADFVISGAPFTAGELSAANRQASDVIKAPFLVASLAVLLRPPIVPLNELTDLPPAICNPNDPNVPDPDACTVRKPFTGPFQFPAANLAAMLLNYRFDENGQQLAQPLTSWNHPAVLAALGVKNLATQVPSRTSPDVVGRSDADEIGFMVKKFAAQFAPKVWALLQARPGLDWNLDDERLGDFPTFSRDGASQQVGWVGLTGDTLGFPDGIGKMAYAPASSRLDLARSYPLQKIVYVRVRNGHGDWVEPTTKTINAAVDAGGETPLYAFDHDVSGAYPFVWVDHLYAPAHGLSPEKTEGIAMLIRYVATAGQNALTAVGEGRLPPALVTQGLQAADALVQSNCSGTDRVLTTSADPGPQTPAGAAGDALRGIGSMKHCRAIPKPPATNAPASHTGGNFTPSATGGDGSTGTSDGSGATAGGDGTGSANGTGTATGGDATTGPDAPAAAGTGQTATRSRPGILTATQLPLPVPGPGTSTDRLGAFVLGVVLYLLLRKPAARAFRRVFL